MLHMYMNERRKGYALLVSFTELSREYNPDFVLLDERAVFPTSESGLEQLIWDDFKTLGYEVEVNERLGAPSGWVHVPDGQIRFFLERKLDAFPALARLAQGEDHTEEAAQRREHNRKEYQKDHPTESASLNIRGKSLRT